MYARPFIDSLDFARNGQKLCGEVPIGGLPRLQDVIENQDDALSYTVLGVVDKQGNPALDLSITGDCRLLCQRCLGGMDYSVRIDTRLLLRSQESMDALDKSVASGEEEEFDSILADTHLEVLDLLEEEILLSLPIAPRHEAGACKATEAGGVQDEVQHPFAVLANLKCN